MPVRPDTQAYVCLCDSGRTGQLGPTVQGEMLICVHITKTLAGADSNMVHAPRDVHLDGRDSTVWRMLY